MAAMVGKAMKFASHTLAASRLEGLSRRQFISRLLIAAMSVRSLRGFAQNSAPEVIIDDHQHLNYSGRSDEVFLEHQRLMGISKTILLPAGRSVKTPSTHDGVSNGLEAKCAGNETCYQFAKAHPESFLFGANEVPDVPDATREIEKYLKRGAVVIGEQKFGIDCDSPQMQEIYQLAANHGVPVLMHWQVKMYNYGFERFHRMLEKYPKTLFIAHAQTWWANIDKSYQDDPKNLYPKGKVTAGGLTDRYLTDYPNMYGDLSAGSGLNALQRDEEHAREFLRRHQNKLIYGSDCSDLAGTGTACQGSQTIATLKKLAPDRTVQKKLFYENAKRVFKI